MADEQINIATINIDVKDFIKSASQAATEMAQLRKENRELTKEGKKGNQQFVQNDVRIRELSKTYRQQRNAATALEGATKDLTEAQKFEGKSVQEVTNQRANLIKISRTIKGDTQEEIALRDKLNGIIDKQTDYIREQSSTFRGNKDRIGEYTEGINNSIIGNTKLGQVLNQGLGTLKQTQADYRKVTAAVKAKVVATKNLTSANGIVKNSLITLNGVLKLTRVALISTGVGALVVALGSLIAFLTTTTEGARALNKVMRPLKEIIGETLGILQDIGKALFDAFGDFEGTLDKVGSAIKSQLIDRFNAVSKIIRGIVTLDRKLINEGVALNKKANDQIRNSVNSSIDAITDRYDEAIDRGSRLAELDRRISKGKNDLILKEQELRTEIKQANKDAEDTTKGLEEREAAALRSITASEELLAAQQKLKDEQIERAKLENEANDTSAEDQAALNRLIAERSQLEEQALELQTTQTNKLNIIRRQFETDRQKAAAEQLAKEEKRIDEQIKRSEDELKLFLAQQGIKAQSKQEELDTAREIADREKEILKQKYDAGKISEVEYQTELLNIRKEYQSKQVDVALEFAERELEIEQSRIDQTIANEDQKNARLIEAEKNYLAEKLELGKISQIEYNQAISEIDEQERIRKQELEQERREIDLENRIALETNSLEQVFQAKLTQLQSQRQRELEIAEQTGADKTLINKKFDALELDLERQKRDQEIALAGDTVGSIAKIVGEQTAAGKALALVQALINTYQGISAGVALGFPAAIPAVAAAAATGFEAVRNIKSTKVPKASKGFSISGRSHSNGGQIIEAEGGEAVVNKTAMASPFGGVVSEINQRFGNGVPLAARGMRAGSGSPGAMGATRSLLGSLINYDMMGDKFAEAVSKIPPSQVSVQEIQSVGRDYLDVTERANI